MTRSAGRRVRNQHHTSTTLCVKHGQKHRGHRCGHHPPIWHDRMATHGHSHKTFMIGDFLPPPSMPPSVRAAAGRAPRAARDAAAGVVCWVRGGRVWDAAPRDAGTLSCVESRRATLDAAATHTRPLGRHGRQRVATWRQSGRRKRIGWPIWPCFTHRGRQW